MARRRPSGEGMVRKRATDGRWEGRIVVGHKENGSPIFQTILAKTQKELTSKLNSYRETFKGVNLTEDSRMTLGEWLDIAKRKVKYFASQNVKSSHRSGEITHFVRGEMKSTHSP